MDGQRIIEMRGPTGSFNEEATQRLSQLEGRPGLTPNILCRVAFCLSLKEPGPPDINRDSQGMEFNRFTLTGEWDAFYTALLKMSLMNSGLDPDQDQLTHLKTHIERGVALLHNRVRDLADLQTL